MVKTLQLFAEQFRHADKKLVSGALLEGLPTSIVQFLSDLLRWRAASASAVVLQSAEGGFFCKSNEKSVTAWEGYAAIRWVHEGPIISSNPAGLSGLENGGARPFCYRLTE